MATVSAATLEKRAQTIREKHDLRQFAMGYIVVRQHDGGYHVDCNEETKWQDWESFLEWVLGRYAAHYGTSPSQAGINAFVRHRHRIADAIYRADPRNRLRIVKRGE